MDFGRSLELFFVNGNPDGILAAKVFNWTGHILKAPRTQIKEALSRPEARHTGIYLLLGENNGEPFAYVGEGEVIADRIKQHEINRGWWETVIFISTAANELNKAHIRYLESRVINLAQAARVYALDNGNSPALPRLAEAVVANMEEFLDRLQLVLPAIGVPLLVNRVVQESKRPDDEETASLVETVQFILRSPKRQVTAHARISEGQFVVLAGSQAAAWTGVHTTYSVLSEKLTRDGVINNQASPGVFTVDYAFSSPSAAAAVCLGRAANGRTEWVDESSDRTYGDLETASVGVV